MRIILNFAKGYTEMTGGYNTESKKQLMALFIKNANRQFTPGEIIEELNKNGVIAGQSTIYRQIKKLCDAGLIKKYSENGTYKYQYKGKECECDNHMHLKCTSCEKVFHIECCTNELVSRIYKSHGFKVDSGSTILYGTCSACSKT